MSDYALCILAPIVGVISIRLILRAIEQRAKKRSIAHQKAWQLARGEESRELDRIMLESEQNAARHQAHLAQKKDFVPLVLPPKEPHKPEPPLTDAEAQALDLAKHRKAYQETVWDRELREQAQARVVPTRVIDRQSKLIKTYTPRPTTRTYEPVPDTSLSLLTTAAVCGFYDSDTSSPSPDPTPSWNSSDDSSGSGFGGGGSSGEW